MPLVNFVSCWISSQLFKIWITLSTGWIFIHWTTQLVFLKYLPSRLRLRAMALVAIYPLKSASQLLGAFFFLVVKLNMLINIKSSDVVFCVLLRQHIREYLRRSRGLDGHLRTHHYINYVNPKRELVPMFTLKRPRYLGYRAGLLRKESSRSN